MIDYTSGGLHHYKRYYDSETNTFTVTFWDYGYKKYSEEDPEKWNTAVSLVKDQCADTMNSARKTDETVHIVFKLRNDDDVSSYLLIAEDGEITFDISAE